jgi:hypothetical protein
MEEPDNRKRKEGMTLLQLTDSDIYKALAARVVAQAICDYLGVGMALSGNYSGRTMEEIKEKARAWFWGEDCQWYLDYLDINTSGPETFRKAMVVLADEQNRRQFLSVFVK